jgi:hypothetical protein
MLAGIGLFAPLSYTRMPVGNSNNLLSATGEESDESEERQ